MKTKMTENQSWFRAKAQSIVCGLLTAVVLLLTGCNDDNDEGTPYIKISPSTEAIAFSAEATESYVYKIETNQPLWLAASDQDWCKVTMDPYNNEFTVTALRNEENTPPPPATITVSAGSENVLTITATQAAMTDYDVYVSGYYHDESFKYTACYWKNNVLTRLPVADEAANSECFSVAVSNNTVYMAGSIDNRGCYWKDGQLVNLSSQELAPAISIAIDNDKVHLCGSDYYWTNNNKVNAPASTSSNINFTGNAMAVSNGSVFIVGHNDMYFMNNPARQAASWNGTTSGTRPLSIPSGTKSTDNSATCAFASNNVFYAGGYYVSEDTKSPCYWKNGECTTLEVPQGMTENTVGAICVAGEHIYAAGVCGEESSPIACYWENGIRKELELPAGADNIELTGITVAGGKVYTTGHYLDAATGKPNACYWIDAKRTDLLKVNNGDAYATGIALIAK